MWVPIRPCWFKRMPSEQITVNIQFTIMTAVTTTKDDVHIDVQEDFMLYYLATSVVSIVVTGWLDSVVSFIERRNRVAYVGIADV